MWANALVTLPCHSIRGALWTPNAVGPGDGATVSLLWVGVGRGGEDGI